MFLDYGSDKRLVVKGYVDASFDTNLDDSKARRKRLRRCFGSRNHLED